MSYTFNVKNNRKAMIVAAVFVFCLFFFMPSFSPRRLSKLPVSSSYQMSAETQVTYNNLNNDREPQARILVLTPLKDAVPYLDRYFELLDQTTYPNHLISIAFLVSDTTDDTVKELYRHAERLQGRFWWNRFHDIRVFEKDFHFDLPNDQRHKYEMQPLRRSVMARSRNYLLASAMRDDIQYVAWVDVDVIEYPNSIFEDLMSVNEDVVVPNCLLHREDGAFYAYDKNNWQETEESWAIQKDLDPEFVLLEGYYEFPTHRYLMVDMPTHKGMDYKVPLDGVGATFTLVKAHVHREGANFPAYPFQHQVETEGFAKMAKAMGFTVYGIPGYLIYHIENH
ncbi:Anp1-domain-containing protein [Gongronella butleri]|nr:Anp1-domain-containing protein [Gongronella butleri]